MKKYQILDLLPSTFAICVIAGTVAPIMLNEMLYDKYGTVAALLQYGGGVLCLASGATSALIAVYFKRFQAIHIVNAILALLVGVPVTVLLIALFNWTR